MAISTISRTTNPTSWLGVTRAEMESQLVIGADFEGSRTDSIIEAATQWVQARSEQSIIATSQSQTFTMTLDAWPSNAKKAIYLANGPLSSISSFTYLDSAGDSTTLVANTDYKLNNSTGNKIAFVTSIDSWPNIYTSDYRDKITIVYVTGYTAVPAWAKEAIKAYGTYLYEAKDAYLTIAESLVSYNRIYFDWKLNE